MNTSYSSLRRLASILNALGWIQIVLPCTFAAITILSGDLHLLMTWLLIIILAVLVAIIWFAFAQFIKLFLDIAAHVENIDNNIYMIASKTEKN